MAIIHLDTNDPAVINMISHVSTILKEFGAPMDGSDENFTETPMRFLKYLRHYFQPYTPDHDLSRTFPPKQGTQVQGGDNDNVEKRFGNAMIVQTGIPYRAVCAHHLVPVLGTAHVGYIPKERVVGLSKLSRLVYGLSHKMPSLQEDVNNEIVDALQEHLEPYGCMAVIEAEHGCMACRGIEESAVSTVTAAVRGVFIKEIPAREEFYELVRLGGNRVR